VKPSSPAGEGQQAENGGPARHGLGDLHQQASWEPVRNIAAWVPIDLRSDVLNISACSDLSKMVGPSISSKNALGSDRTRAMTSGPQEGNMTFSEQLLNKVFFRLSDP
jgi:hypothetical protein